MQMTMMPVGTDPTLSLAHGKAWQLDLPAIKRRRRMPEQCDASIDAWLIEAPWAHPAWHSYLLTLIHLRDTLGLVPPKIYRPHATHELVLMALDPRGDRNRLLSLGIGEDCRPLHPVNFAAQIVEISDDLARVRVRQAVEMVCAGELSPDTDFRAQWIALFGDSMVVQ